MSVHDQAKQNMEMVQQMMQEATSKKTAAVQAGNSALIDVEIYYTADSGTFYEGVLQFRRPSPMDYMKMGAIKANMFRALGIQPMPIMVEGRVIESMAHVDAPVKFLANAMAAMEILLVNAPDWAKDYRNLPDTDLLTLIYNKFDDALVSFRGGAQAVPTGDNETTVGAENVPSAEAVRERESQGTRGDTSADRPEA